MDPDRDMHLVLLMEYTRYPIDLSKDTSTQVRFKVGLSTVAKPSHEAMASAFRSVCALATLV